METVSADRLMQQAPETAAFYLAHAVQHIDRIFGKGYAKAHPELTAAFMQTSAIDLAAMMISSAITELRENV